MTDFLRRSWAVVDLGRLERNVQAVRSGLSLGTMLMGVVKADAYGHGDRYVASRLAELGVDWFGVSNLDEAVSLRAHGICKPVLIFGITPPEHVKTLAEYNITATIHSLEYARALDKAAEAAGVFVQGHLKLDTGMSRLGFVMTGSEYDTVLAEAAEACRLSRLKIPGVYTHFSCADELDEDSIAFTRGQFEYFLGAVGQLEKSGIRFAVKHCCNSAATMLYPEMHLDMVRPGIILYGLSPGRELNGRAELCPVMDLFSCITMLKEIDEGRFVSYGRCYTAHRKMKVATVPIGYADGYSRELTNKARMLVRGHFANVIGRVCMDQLMLDVTHIEGVRAGDIVTIVGEDSGRRLGFDEMADLSGSINYEKTCLIGKRVPRIYRQGGKDIGVVDYIRRFGS